MYLIKYFYLLLFFFVFFALFGFISLLLGAPFANGFKYSFINLLEVIVAFLLYVYAKLG